MASNRLTSDGLELILSQTEKSCIAYYYRIFHECQNKIIGPFGLTKLVLI